ncbi:unnamed protein product [Caenorhabditis angaria]|uniref:Uncharacterized protein n=1 Tax=Caenorhabditis angaria TaxID=860376 RepID=A0A9P1J4T7_9PELO|nr:unnamed protein product [Caenorhabditis angaria]
MNSSAKYAELLPENANVYLENCMDEIEIQTNDSKSRHRASYQIKRSVHSGRLTYSALLICLDIILLRSLSIVDGDLKLTKIDVTFKHPNLPNGGELSFFEEKYSDEKIEEMALALQFAEMRDPRFVIDGDLKFKLSLKSS